MQPRCMLPHHAELNEPLFEFREILSSTLINNMSTFRNIYSWQWLSYITQLNINWFALLFLKKYSSTIISFTNYTFLKGISILLFFTLQQLPNGCSPPPPESAVKLQDCLSLRDAASGAEVMGEAGNAEAIARLLLRAIKWNVPGSAQRLHSDF